MSMKKVKNIYYDDFAENKTGLYGTGLFIETEDGKFYRHQTSDPVMPFERIKELPKKA